MQTSLVIHDAEKLQALAHPVRVAILGALGEGRSAAEVARSIGQGRQNTGYHLKELEKAGFVRPAGERRKGAFVEQLFVAAANTILISPRLALTPEQLAMLKDRVSLEHLLRTGERIVTDTASLLDEAAHGVADVPSATVVADVRFGSETDRSQFMAEYAAAIKPLLTKYGSATGDLFRVVLAAYPNPEEHP